MPTVTPERLKEVVIEVLKGLGAGPDETPIVAESLVRAEMRGTDTHGLPYLKLLVERVEARMVSLPTRVTTVKDEGATTLLDGGNGIGQFAGWRAMGLSIQKAREFGVGMTLVRHTNNLGFLAFYTLHAAAQGFVGLTMGTAIESGFVPKKASAPPHGEMAAFAFPIVRPTNPCAAACRV
jgi:LDH2 family malate/lactate/ureidoglycolate dehydrogenase